VNSEFVVNWSEVWVAWEPLNLLLVSEGGSPVEDYALNLRSLA
jgi:hypothetical protein